MMLMVVLYALLTGRFLLLLSTKPIRSFTVLFSCLSYGSLTTWEMDFLFVSLSLATMCAACSRVARA